MTQDELRRLVALLDLKPGFYEDLANVQEHVPELREAFAALRRGIAEAADERRKLARRLRAIADSETAKARSTCPRSDEEREMAGRMAVGRYYYSVHHVLRALCMCTAHYDPGREGAGHEPVIEHAAELAKNDREFLARLRRVEDLGAKIGLPSAQDQGYHARAAQVVRVFIEELHDLRKRADYDPLGTPRATTEPVCFAAEAERLEGVVGSFMSAVDRLVADRCSRLKEVS